MMLQKGSGRCQYRCQVKAPTGTISYTDIYELYVYEETGKYTAEIMKIYEKTR